MKATVFVSGTAPRCIGTLGTALACLVFFVALVSSTFGADPADPGWPRVFTSGDQQVTVYQPQVDYWNGFTNLQFRCAIAVKGVTPQEKFGVVEVDATTVADQPKRTVVVIPTKRRFSFPKTSDAETAPLTATVNNIHPLGQPMTVSLDRILACPKPAEQTTQSAVDTNPAPPKMFYSSLPAILLMFMGEPKFKPVAANRTDLMFGLNANWDVFYDTASQQYYLLDGESWLTAAEPKGPWTAAQLLPQSLSSLPRDQSWNRIRQNIPG